MTNKGRASAVPRTRAGRGSSLPCELGRSPPTQLERREAIQGSALLCGTPPGEGGSSCLSPSPTSFLPADTKLFQRKSLEFSYARVPRSGTQDPSNIQVRPGHFRAGRGQDPRQAGTELALAPTHPALPHLSFLYLLPPGFRNTMEPPCPVTRNGSRRSQTSDL